MDDYDIYIRSFARGRAEPAEVGLNRVFGIDMGRARELMRSLPRVVKRHVPAEHLPRYEQALRTLGAEYELRRSAIRPVQTIAVRGSALEATQREEHDLTLPLPPPTPEPTPRATAPATADTRIDARPPAHRAPVAEQAPRPNAAAASAAMSAAESTAASTDTRVDARPPVQRAPLVEQAPRPDPAAAASVAMSVAVSTAVSTVSSAAPKRGRVEPKWGEPQAAAKSPWTPIEPIENAEHRSEPQSWSQPVVHMDGRPDWLEDGPRAYHHSAAGDLLISSATDGGESTVPALDERVLASGRPSASPIRARTLHAAAAARVGTVAGRELVGDEPSGMLRLLLKVCIGVALLAVLAVVARQFHLVDQVRRTLASLTHSGTSTSVGAGAEERAGAYGPVASDWLEPEVHQFTNGDKDRVRELVRRFEDAGAVGVYVGHITRSGGIQIGGELVVELPDAASKRSAVLAEYQRFLQATFGELVAAPSDPGGDVLRVAL